MTKILEQLNVWVDETKLEVIEIDSKLNAIRNKAREIITLAEMNYFELDNEELFQEYTYDYECYLNVVIETDNLLDYITKGYIEFEERRDMSIIHEMDDSGEEMLNEVETLTFRYRMDIYECDEFMNDYNLFGLIELRKEYVKVRDYLGKLMVLVSDKEKVIKTITIIENNED